MKIAITGASGKTGYRVTEEALKKGIKVKQIVRKNSKLPENLKNTETIRISLENKGALDKALENVDALIIEEFNGQVPNSFEELESLPGVGHKTASVVMAQVFNIPSFPVDTHIHRLSQRWGLTNGDNVKQTEKDLKNIFPISEWNILHLQIIFYGRDYCTARGCDGTKCLMCRTLYPNRRKKFICKKP